MKALVLGLAAVVLAGCAGGPVLSPLPSPTSNFGAEAPPLAAPHLLHEASQDAAEAVARGGIYHATVPVPEGGRHVTLYFSYAGQGDVTVRMEDAEGGTYDSGRRRVQSQPGSEGAPLRFAEWHAEGPSFVLHVVSTGVITWKARAEGWAPATLALTTSAFEDGQRIPDKHACDGRSAGVSPALNWRPIPANSQALAVYMEDVDVGGGFSFPHWWLPDLPLETTAIAEGADPRAGTETAYFGPCPPPNWPHRYHVWVLALDEKPGASAPTSLESLRPHVLAYGYVHGVYGCTDQTCLG